MAIRYNLWIDPDNVAQHRAVEADLEHYFIERFADYPHIRLFGADPYDYDAPFNRLYDVLMTNVSSLLLLNSLAAHHAGSKPWLRPMVKAPR